MSETILHDWHVEVIFDDNSWWVSHRVPAPTAVEALDMAKVLLLRQQRQNNASNAPIRSLSICRASAQEKM